MRNFLFILLCMLSVQAFGQDRYKDYVFEESEIMELDSLLYGANFTVLTVADPRYGHTVKQPLLYDLYQPREEPDHLRPLVLYFHTGNFLPPKINGGPNGSREDSSTVFACKKLARLGYVVASCDYRLGWNPIASEESARNFGLINAAYRGVQDARTAIRYFKRTVAEFGNPYQIDTSKIVVWGQGTGGYISLNTAAIDNYPEIVQTEDPVGKFILQVDGTPIPMVIPQLNGDIYGTSTGVSVGNPAIPDGDTLCVPNHLGYSSDFNMAVNMGGAMGDISWADEVTKPIVSFHAPTDLNAPYKSFVLRVPTAGGALNVVKVQGSYLVNKKLDSLNVNENFKGIDDAYTTAAKAASAKAGHDYIEGLYPLIVRSTTINGAPYSDSSPWDFWDKDIWSNVINETFGASIHQLQSLSNPDMSKEKSYRYLDTVMYYFAPRAYAQLGLDNLTTSVEKIDPSQISYTISPNPAKNMVTISVAPEQTIEQIRIMNVRGQEVARYSDVKDHRLRISVSDLSPGVYYVKTEMKDGIATQKLMIQ